MEYAIALLENEKKLLERKIFDYNLMCSDRKQTAQYLKQIKELKRAVKILRTKIRAQV